MIEMSDGYGYQHDLVGEVNNKYLNNSVEMPSSEGEGNQREVRYD